MQRPDTWRMLGATLTLSLLLAACAPAAPAGPTAAPAKPTEAPKPAATSAPAKPAEAPAAKPAEAKPAASPAAAAKPAEAKPATSPAAKPSFDEKAVADFYRGKIVRFIVGASVGGGFDTYTRAIARHLGRFTPGNPNVIVENMTGGGGLVAANHVYRAAPKDGTAIGHFSSAVLFEQLFDTPGVEFDMARFNHLAVPVSESYMMIVHKRTGISKFEEVLGPNGKEVVIGSVSGGSTERAPVMLRDMLGAKIKLVSGFQGTANVRQAIESGEVDGFFNTWQSVKITNSKEVENGDWRILVQLNDKPMADLPGNVPTLLDITKDDLPRRMLLLGISYPARIGFDLAAPPDVPADRVAALEAAFKQTFEDKDFLADAEKARLEIGPVYRQEMQRIVADLMGMPADVKDQLRKVYKPS